VVDYYMTPVSPYTYLGHERFRAICRRHGAQVRLKVADYGKVFPVSGGLPLKDRAPQRRAYRLVELRRWRDHLGLPLTLEPKYFPVPGTLAATTIIAVRETLGTEPALDVAGDLMQAMWVDERDISSADTVRDILATRGLDAAPLLAQAPAMQAQFDADTQEAIDRGVFGAPTYVLRGELFWGQDRLEFLDRALVS
jgi:carboxymethylenebutenolidase